MKACSGKSGHNAASAVGLRLRLTGRATARSVMPSGGKAMTRLLILFSIPFVVVSAIIAWMLRAYQLSASLVDIYVGLALSLKVFAFAILGLTVVGAVAGLKGNVSRVREAAILTVIFGVLGAAYGELNTHFGVLIDNVITFATLAPLRIESLAILALALLGATLSLGVLHLRGGVPRG